MSKDDEPRSSSSAGSSRSDPELDAALETFLDRVDEELPAPPPYRLPPLRDTHHLEVGSTLGGFRLEEELGSGGMGVVFRAREVAEPHRIAAIKIMKSLFPSEDTRARFQREIEIVKSLDHPGIVPILSSGIEGGIAYAAMEFIDGLPASRVIRRLRQAGRLPVSTREVHSILRGETGEPPSPTAVTPPRDDEPYPFWVARIIAQVAEGLQYAHDHGVIHRDVKPSNIIITREDRPVVVDFGLANLQEGDRLTTTGAFLGTLNYASPEQVSRRTVDGRTDVYSAGITLYEFLSLTKAFDSRDDRVLEQRILDQEIPPLPRSTPTALRIICSTATARVAKHRYPDPGALAEDLRRFLAGDPISARTPSWSRRIGTTIRRHPRAVVVLGLVLLAFVGIRVRDQWQAARAVREISRKLLPLMTGEPELVGTLGAIAALRDDSTPRNFPKLLNLERQRERVRLWRHELERTYEALAMEARAVLANVSGHSGALKILAHLKAKKLELHLRLGSDYLDPGPVRVLTEELKALDRAGRFKSLSDNRGRITIETEPQGASLEIFELDPDAAGSLAEGGAPDPILPPPPVFAGVTVGPTTLTLTEGSYLALARFPGRAPSRYPFLVRRDRCQELGGQIPPSEHVIELLPEDELVEGFAFIPRGWTLVDTDPPHWVLVDSFQMKIHELTNREYLRLINAVDPGRAGSMVPQVGGMKLVKRSGDRWQLAEEAHPDWPLRGLAILDFSPRDVQTHFFPDIEGWFVARPGSREWIRAARGGDGRRYPFGNVFRWRACAAYYSNPVESRDPTPFPVGQFPEDRSPFGVQDLAGSVREFLMENSGPLRDTFLAAGGSFRSHQVHQLAIDALTEMNSAGAADVGFRLILRRVPPWHRSPPEPARAFHDDFDRRGSQVGNGWRTGSVDPFEIPSALQEPRRCPLAGGRLIVEGGVDNFSKHGCVFRKITIPGRAVVRLELALSAAREQPGNRGFQVILQDGYLPHRTTRLSASVTLDGGLSLTMASPGQELRQTPTRPTPDFDVRSDFVFELGLLPNRVEARLYPRGRERPATAGASIALSTPLSGFHFIELRAYNYVGVKAAIDEIRIEPGP